MDGSRVLPNFKNFDDSDVFKAGERYNLRADALNFALEFDSDKALYASDLNTDSVKSLLQATPKPTKTRWINLWCPERQKDTVEAIGTHYGLSRRNIGFMTTDPNKPVVAATETPQSPFRAMFHGLSRLKDSPSLDSHAADVEMTSADESPVSHSMSLDLNHYLIIDEVWYFCSIDWGDKYLCVGYNSLSQVDPDPVGVNKPSERMQNKPQGKRLWTWLILCHDRTVITITENPFLHHEGPLTAREERKLPVMRRNLINVFQQLSKADHPTRDKNPINVLPIRSGIVKTREGDEEISDAPSLLFHYIFDDWYASYSLVAKREHQYGKQLGKLRDDMFEKPIVDHIKKLHDIGQQLSVLKRIYQSYTLIIDRILERQRPVDLSSSSHLLKENLNEDTSLLTAQTRSYAVALSSAATVRFERLRDRIQLYALSEIQDCIEEKEALVGLNFNLITLKQSDAVERLTRITILLAKVTILFMPVSLMTAYFSVQIEDLQGAYTSTTYWACFAVVMALSVLLLFVFGKISNTLEGTVIYRSMTRAFLDSSRKLLGLKERQKAAMKMI